MKLKTLMAVGTALGLASFGAPAMAATSFFTDFDSVVVAPGGYTIVNAVEGWYKSGGAGIEIQNHAAGTPYSESNLVELDSDNNSSMSYDIDAGSYTLDFFLSPRPGVSALSNGLQLLISGLAPVEFLTLDGSGLNDTAWQHQIFNFTLAAPGSITFSAIGTSDSYGSYLDSIRLTPAAVPEPAAWALMLCGFAVVGSAMRSRKTQVAFS